jgi:hypothetical protein
MDGGVMKMRWVVAAAVFLVATSGVAWAGKEAYQLVMSTDEKLCKHMLTLFNSDMKKYRRLEYEKHKEFVTWEPVETGEIVADKYCRQTLKQTFDINNDGNMELVIRTRSCFQSQLTDSLYIFPLNSNAVELLKDPASQVLASTPNKLDAMDYELKKWHGAGELLPGIYTVLTLEPFKFGQKFYVSMTDLRQEVIVIAKYLHGKERDDICYFRGKPLI